MRRYISVILLWSVFIVGCKIVNPGSIEPGKIETSYVISDTTGIETTVFRSGENFDVAFTIINNTGRDLHYHYSGPRVYFEIIQNDSVLTSSVEGLVWAAVLLTGVLKEGDSLSSSWRVPNSPQDLELGDTTVLKPGRYQVKARIAIYFEDYPSISPEVKEITIE